MPGPLVLGIAIVIGLISTGATIWFIHYVFYKCMSDNYNDDYVHTETVTATATVTDTVFV